MYNIVGYDDEQGKKEVAEEEAIRREIAIPIIEKALIKDSGESSAHVGSDRAADTFAREPPAGREAKDAKSSADAEGELASMGRGLTDNVREALLFRIRKKQSLAALAVALAAAHRSLQAPRDASEREADADGAESELEALLLGDRPPGPPQAKSRSAKLRELLDEAKLKASPGSSAAKSVSDKWMRRGLTDL